MLGDRRQNYRTITLSNRAEWVWVSVPDAGTRRPTDKRSHVLKTYEALEGGQSVTEPAERPGWMLTTESYLLKGLTGR